MTMARPAIIITAIIITMTDPAALQRLLAWTSPAFPVGAFGYSGGMETMIAAGCMPGRDAVRQWIEDGLARGTMRNDAIFAVEAHRHRDDAFRLAELAELYLALCAACERHEETAAMGAAFAAAARAWQDSLPAFLPDPCPYPVAFGAAAAGAGIVTEAMLTGFLSAQVQAQISVAVRLVPIGQSEGLAILAGLEPVISRMAQELAMASIDDLGSVAIAADIAAMAHETLATRIFRS